MDLTMVITTFNRDWLLRRSFARLCDLTKPDELLIVDDGGHDDTIDVCREFSDRLPIEYVYNNNPGRTICSLARNIGVRKAKHDWIVTSEPELLYLSDVLALFPRLQDEHPGKVISSGKVWFAPDGWEPSGDLSPPPGAQAADGWVAPHTALWHRDWLAAIGGWDETFPGGWGWDDTDLLCRLSATGHGQFISPEITAIHQWHGLGADGGSVNETHFLSKSFHADPEDTTDLVANIDRQWGSLRT